MRWSGIQLLLHHMELKRKGSPEFQLVLGCDWLECALSCLLFFAGSHDEAPSWHKLVVWSRFQFRAWSCFGFISPPLALWIPIEATRSPSILLAQWPVLFFTFGVSYHGEVVIGSQDPHHLTPRSLYDKSLSIFSSLFLSSSSFK